MEGRRPGGWLPSGRLAAHPLMSTAHGDLDEVAFEVVVNNEPTDCCTSDELSGTLLASTRPCDLCVAPAVRTATRAHPQPRLPPHRPRLVEVGLEVAVGLLHGAHSPTCAFMLASLHLDHVAAHTTTARPHLLTHRAASPCPQDHHQPTSMTPTSMTATSTQHGTGSLRCRPASIRRSLDQTEVCLLPVRPDHRRRRHRCRRCRRRHHRCRPTTSPTSAQRGRRRPAPPSLPPICHRRRCCLCCPCHRRSRLALLPPPPWGRCCRTPPRPQQPEGVVEDGDLVSSCSSVS